MTQIDLDQFSTPVEAVVPIFNGEGVYQGRHFQINIADGWYRVQLGDSVVPVRTAGGIEVDEALQVSPVVRGFTIADSIVPLNFDSTKFKYGYSETIPVRFIKSELWDVIVAHRWEDDHLYYGGLDYSFDTGIVDDVKKRFETEESLEGIKNLTPELRYVYLLLCLQRDNFRELDKLRKLKLSELERKKRLEEFQKTLGGRVLKTIEDAGGKLTRFHRQGPDKLVVVWGVGNQKVNTLVDLDFRILELGYCAENQDRQHTLSSAVTLAQVFQRDQDLYLTRE